MGPLLFLIYMNDIPQASSYFKFIPYADDTTLFSTIQLQSAPDTDINQELIRVHDWLAVNRLSLNYHYTFYRGMRGSWSECHFVFPLVYQLCLDL